MPSGKSVGRSGPADQGGPVDQGDLKAVRGIGPKVEARLKRAGIKDLGQLAHTPVNELAAALAGLHGKFDTDRIVRERWLTQAVALAAVPASAGLEGETTATANPVRHNFTVEVRLPLADRDIVSSKVVHVQTGDEETWTGWDPQRMVAFIVDRSRVRPGARPGVRPEMSSEPQRAPRSGPQASTLPQGTASAAPRAAASTGTPGITPAPTREGRDDRKAGLHTYAMVPASEPGTIGGRTGAVTATLIFDSATLSLSVNEIATVKAEVFARQLLAGSSILVGRSLATVSSHEHVRLDIPCDLSEASRPITLFAVVRVLAGDGEARRPAKGLADASLVISKATQERSALPPSMATRSAVLSKMALSKAILSKAMPSGRGADRDGAAERGAS